MSEVPLAELERRMQPGVFSKAGFLGEGERLLPLLEEDRLTLDALGLNFAVLGNRLEELIGLAASQPSRRAHVPPCYSVAVSVTKGFQICPWATDPHARQCVTGRGAEFSGVTWQIKNERTGKMLEGSGLIPHLIRDHHFFEGKRSPFRIEPRELAELLDLPSRG